MPLNLLCQSAEGSVQAWTVTEEDRKFSAPAANDLALWYVHSAVIPARLWINYARWKDLGRDELGPGTDWPRCHLLCVVDRGSPSMNHRSPLWCHALGLFHHVIGVVATSKLSSPSCWVTARHGNPTPVKISRRRWARSHPNSWFVRSAPLNWALPSLRLSVMHPTHPQPAPLIHSSTQSPDSPERGHQRRHVQLRRGQSGPGLIPLLWVPF
jgi:hypothetical protein